MSVDHSVEEGGREKGREKEREKKRERKRERERDTEPKKSFSIIIHVCSQNTPDQGRRTAPDDGCRRREKRRQFESGEAEGGLAVHVMLPPPAHIHSTQSTSVSGRHKRLHESLNYVKFFKAGSLIHCIIVSTIIKIRSLYMYIYDTTIEMKFLTSKNSCAFHFTSAQYAQRGMRGVHIIIVIPSLLFPSHPSNFNK